MIRLLSDAHAFSVASACEKKLVVVHRLRTCQKSRTEGLRRECLTLVAGEIQHTTVLRIASLERPECRDNVDRLFLLVLLLLRLSTFSTRMREERVAYGLTLRYGRESGWSVRNLARQLGLDELHTLLLSVALAVNAGKVHAQSHTSDRGSLPSSRPACSSPRRRPLRDSRR